MRSVVIAIWFSVAATGALASGSPPPVVAAETTRPAVSATLPTAQAGMTPLAGSQLAAAPASSSKGVDGSASLLRVAGPLSTAGDGAKARQGRGQGEEVGEGGEVGKGSLTAAALLLMAVVMIRRRGTIRTL